MAIRSIFVVDLNALQRQTDKLCTLLAEGHRLVLPSEAIFEMIKGGDWRYALRRSLKPLAARPSHAHLALSLGDALLWERDNRKPLAPRLFSREATRILREILGALRTDAPDLPVNDEGVEEFRTLLKGSLFNNAKNKSDLLRMVNLAGQECFPADFTAKLRCDQVSDEERLAKIKDEADGLMSSRLRAFGYTAAMVESFKRKSPLFLRWGYVRLWYACDWLARGGVESFKESNATNEALDCRYVVLASCFDGLISEDNKMQRALGDVRQIVGDAGVHH